MLNLVMKRLMCNQIIANIPELDKNRDVYHIDWLKLS